MRVRKILAEKKAGKGAVAVWQKHRWIFYSPLFTICEL